MDQPKFLREGSMGLAVLLCLFSFNSVAQKFKLPDIPKYDSMSVDSYAGKIQMKTYFLNKQKVFFIGYNAGSMFYTPYSHIAGSSMDSCYAYFNGKDHDEYDFYYLSESVIVNEKYSERSLIFRYSKFRWNKKPIEHGNYYFIKRMSDATLTHSPQYKIGKWVTYNTDGKIIKTIDYDKGTIDGKAIKFEGNLAVIDSLKTLADNKLIEVYGKSFFTKYIRFNLYRSGYHSWPKPRPEQPDGASLLAPTDKKIYFADLSYDIVLGENRFNVIQFRISADGKFLGRTYFPDFMTKYFYLTQGLDTLNTGRFHKNVLNWKKLAAEKGMDITSKDFNVRFDFKPTGDYVGELRLVLEQVTETLRTKHSFTNKLKQYWINPWTGEIKEAEDSRGYQMMMTEGWMEETVENK